MASSFRDDEERISFKTLGRYATILTTLLVTTLTAQNQPSVTGASSRLKVEVRRSDASNALPKHGGRRLADYGSYQLWAFPGDQRATVAGLKGITLREGDDVIELCSGPIHTIPAEPAQAVVPASAAFTGKRLHLVQFAGPIQPDWYTELTTAGLRVVSHIPRNAYLVYGDAQALTKLRNTSRRSPHFQWEGDYQAGHKVHPRARELGKAAQRGETAHDLFAIQLVEDAAANAETLTLLNQISRAWIRQSKQLGYVNCVLHLSPDDLTQVAARPDVVSIQPYEQPQKKDERQGQILAGNLIGDQPGGPGYLAWLTSKGFTAAQFAATGFIVDVTDSGIDNGTTTPGHFGLYTLGNTNLAGRVAYNRLLGTPNFDSTIQACDGHGNLNSHIIAGYDNLDGFPHTDSGGYHYGLGICPFVRVGSSVVFDPYYFTYPDYNELQSRAYQDGTRISCNSWGSSLGGAYSFDSQIYDALVRDAQPAGSPFPTAGNQEMVIIFSAGNSGPTVGSVGTPGSAKNVITIGAAENVRSHSTTNGGNNTDGYDGCDLSDTGADSANDMSDFSSRGPCNDFRFKPDLTAPGTHIIGGVGQELSPGSNGTALACFDGTGVCALPGNGGVGNPNNFFPLGQEFFTTSTGTSHACPAAGGGAALLRQYFINRNWAVPSPAMTKAWLMNSARYMTGINANDTLPSNNQGMGSMNLGMAFDGCPRLRRDQQEEDRFTASGQTRIFEGFIVDSTKPLRITLAWTDAPGSTTGNAYNNDLDLNVTVDGQTYRGNVFNGAVSISGGSADPRNNVESVFLPAGLSGAFTVTITAANINSDGVPNNTDLLDQDFALLIYNTGNDDAMYLIPAGATLLAENCGSGQGAIDPGETVTVDLALKNISASSTTDLVATLLPVGGVVFPSGPQNYGMITGNDGPAVSRAFTFGAVGQCGGQLIATLQLQDGTNDYGTVEFPFQLGVLTTNQFFFTNNTPITINASNAAVTPYPSPIWISGVSGKISRAIVSLNGLSHSRPDDLDIVLVGPQRQAMMLLSDAGGDYDATGLTLHFAGDAINSLPDEAPLTSGSWKPINFDVDVSLPAPAPVAPYATSLSALDGRNPNGLWRLYVADDYGDSEGGGISGWALTLVTTNGVCCLDPASADLVVTMADAPDPASISNTITYTFTVTNNGPAVATNVTLLSTLSSSVVFLNATLSQGSYTQTNDTITCHFGNLSVGGGATALINSLVIAGPQLASTASVTASQPDPNPLNNLTSVTTSVYVPSLTIQDTSVIEGDVSNQSAVFLLSLSEPAVQTAHVDYFTITTNGTAIAGTDYVITSNQVTFLPGEITRTIQVPVIGDALDEDDETFRVLLANPFNAFLTNTYATATILDNDPVPAVSISDGAVVEGSTGTTNAVFSINLSVPSSRSIRVSCSTSNGTAQVGQDYLAITNGLVTFAPGQITSNVTVVVKGDFQMEPNETFYVTLNNPTNAVLGDALGVGSIISDDLVPLVQAAYQIVAESGKHNGVIEPDEIITVSLALTNTGTANTTNLVVTLQPTGGVVSPVGPQSYGVLQAGGPQLSRSFNFSVGISNCGTLTLTFSINDGGASLGTVSFSKLVGKCFFDDFEPGIDLTQWSSFGGTTGSTVLATNYGGNVSSINSLWFGDAGQRFAATRPINTLDSVNVSFYLRLASGNLSEQWETVDLPDEGVVLEYSTNSGAAWVQMGIYNTTNFYAWTPVSTSIPAAAHTTATMFRWRQLSHNGSCCDHWAIDNVLVLADPPPPFIYEQPVERTAFAGGTTTFNVLALGAQPLHFQWRLNGVSLTNATNSTLTLTGLSTNDAGNYSVMVTNTLGSTISSNALLTVVQPTGLTTLLIWDVNSPGTAALSNALIRAGIMVTLSSTVENSYNGNNPIPNGFSAVIHLNGTTYDDDMPLAGQNALRNYVQSGGGYVHNEWDVYEYGTGGMLNMRDLILFDSRGYSEGNVTVSNVSAQSNHPVLAHVPSNFTFQAGFNIGSAHTFPTNPVTVLMRQWGTNDAVAVREFGSGRIVGFHHAGNYEDMIAFNTLLNTNVQQLYIDAVLWAGKPASNTVPRISLQPPSILPDGSFTLWLKHADGTPMIPAEVPAVHVYWTTNIALPFADWQPASYSTVLTNGMLRMDGLNISNAGSQFFRAEQSP